MRIGPAINVSGTGHHARYHVVMVVVGVLPASGTRSVPGTFSFGDANCVYPLD